MSTSNTITSTDLTNILNEVLPAPIEIDAGAKPQSSVAANSYVDVVVTFNITFSSAPNVVVGLVSNSSAGGFGAISAAVVKDSVTTTGFTCRLANKDTSSRMPAFYWIALGA